MHRGADDQRAVGDKIHLHGGWDGFLEVRQQRLDRVDHLDRVGAGFALDGQKLGGLVFEPRAGARVLHSVDGVADVLDPHRRTVAIGDDDLVEASGVEQLVVGVEGNDLVPAFEVALWSIDGRRHQRVANILQADAARSQRTGIDLHMRRIWLLSVDLDLRDALNRRQLLRQDRVGVLVSFGDRHRVGMDDVDQDGAIRRIGLLVGRGVGQVLGQHPGRGVDRGQHILCGALDVALEIELHCDRRRPYPACRGHLRQAWDGGKLLLERGGDGGSHRFRARPGIIDRYHDGRKIDLG